MIYDILQLEVSCDVWNAPNSFFAEEAHDDAPQTSW